MTKKIITGAIIFLLALLGTAEAAAQTLTGSWELYPHRGASYKSIIDTPTKTYFLSDGSLFSLADDNELYFYTFQNRLSDSDVSLIAYNWDKHYLAVAYSNGNLDLLYDDGRVVNLPDIKDAAMNRSRNIGYIAFGGGRLIACTDFGIVVFDDERYEVVESGIYDRKVDQAVVLGDYLVLSCGNQLRVSPLTARHTRLDMFEVPSAYAYTGYNDLAKLSETSFVYSRYDTGANFKKVVRMDFNPETRAFSFTEIRDAWNAVLLHGNGTVTAVRDNCQQCATVVSDGTVSLYNIPADIKAPLVGNTFTSVGRDAFWISVNGVLNRYRVTSNTEYEVTMADFSPEAVTTRHPMQMLWSADGSRMYVANNNSSLLVHDSGNGYREMLTIDCFENGRASDVSPLNVPYHHTSAAAWQKQSGGNKMIGQPNRIILDPEDNNHFFISNSTSGVYSIRGGVSEYEWHVGNSPINDHWGSRIVCTGLDTQGNLWMMDQVESCIYILRDGLHNTPETAIDADWVKLELPGEVASFYDMLMFFSRDGRTVVISGAYRTLFAMDTNGTPTNLGDDRQVNHSRILDMRGNAVEPSTVLCMVEDHDGMVWAATPNGVLTAPKAADIVDAQFRWDRPLVPRNDGTNFGDYLLDTDFINFIAVDHSNRKWIATASSGLYLVSADGTEILAHYSTDNSPLTTNCIYTVGADPQSNKVYVGTDNGFFAFTSDSSPAADDYSEVYAYPNPVRPEYNGWITIAGLMDNSLVKITDASGAVVHQGRSEGGSLIWDGTNMAGERVRTGVYFVMASNYDGSANEAVVTKILFVN